MNTAAKTQFNKLIRNRSGFTLMEMLCALAVGLLASALIALAISTAVKSYKTASLSSDALSLCDTLSISVQNELLYAEDIFGEGTEFDFVSNGLAAGERCKFETDERGTPGLCTVSDNDFYPFAVISSFSALISPNLMVSWDADTASFEVFISVRSNDGETLASSNFVARPFN